MNRKALMFLVIAIALMPIVAASIAEGIEDTLSVIFNAATSDLAYIKAGLWIVLFFALFKGAEKVFPENRGSALVIAMVLSILGTRFMPDEYFMYLGGGYAAMMVAILLMGPFFIGSILGDMLRFGKSGKAVIIIVFYVGLGYALTQWQGVFLEGEATTAFDVATNWMGEHKIITLVIIAVICLVIMFQREDRYGSGGIVIAPAGKR